MNADLFKAVKEAVAQRGESILSELDLKVVKAFISDLAHDVKKSEKNVLIKCLENKFAQILGNVDKAERADCKQKLAEKLSEEEGLKIALCQDTIELLGAILFGEENPPADKVVVPPAKVNPPKARPNNAGSKTKLKTSLNPSRLWKIARNRKLLYILAILAILSAIYIYNSFILWNYIYQAWIFIMEQIGFF